MRIHPTRKNLVKLLATVSLVAGAASVAGVGTFGAYTDTTNVSSNVESGKVSVLMNNAENGVSVNPKDMVPGDVRTFPVTIQLAAGSTRLSDLTVQTVITNQNNLTNALRLSVDMCSVPWTATASALTCSGTTTSVSANGPLGGNGSTSAWGQTAGWLPTINTGAPVYLRATLSLPSNTPSDTAGLTTGITWSMIGTQRTSTSTVITPSLIP
ncbi:hypothetical protein ABLE68_10825 [Nocardioides sp. CN2-186]|uniref:hypothetical protein n=1 Tax=Nocardioides tweenelious TaxID=3156607 RepID=UPI0032B60419